MLPFDEKRLADYSDEELLRYIRASPRMTSLHFCSTTKLSSNLVSKSVSTVDLSDEIAALRFAQNLGIRVPILRRTITTPDDPNSYIIMDSIHGVSLEDCWPELGWIATIRMAFESRKFIQRMRSITSPTAGGLATGKCNSIFLDDFYEIPHHATPGVIQSFITFWLQYSRENRRTYPNTEGFCLHKHLIPPIPTYFVFTHQDLAPRNIMVDNQNKIWLIDWQRAGFYPLYFEYVGMQNFYRDSWSMMAKLRWWVFGYISVGIFSRELKALEIVRDNSLADPLARCVITASNEDVRY